MTVTLADVADRAQVSPATVSRVLNGNYPVAAATRERVLRAVDELDYVANGPASSLAAATSDLVGILVNDIADPFFGIMAGAAQSRIGGPDGTPRKGGEKLAIVCNTGGSPERELTYLTLLQRQRAAAVILTGGAIEDPAHSAAVAAKLTKLAAAGTRIVLCGRPALVGVVGGVGGAGADSAGAGVEGAEGAEGVGVTTPGVASAGTAGADVSGTGVASAGTAGAGTAGAGVAGIGAAGAGAAGGGIASTVGVGAGNAGGASAGAAGTGAAGTGAVSMGVAGTGVAGTGAAGTGVGGAGVAGTVAVRASVAGTGVAGVVAGGTRPAGAGAGGAAGVVTATLVFDNRSGARRLTEHLLALGHTRIGYVAGPAERTTTRHRLEGHRDALGAAGLKDDPALTLHGPFHRASGRAAAARLLDMEPELTAIVAANDTIALGVCAVARERGLRVPEDLSVAGFDDLPSATDTVPALTTVRLPLYEAGARAGLLATGAARPASPDGVETVPAELMVRGSTGVARDGLKPRGGEGVRGGRTNGI